MHNKLTNIKWDVLKYIDGNTNNDLAKLILKGRGYTNAQIDEFLQPSYDDSLADPFLLPDMKKAVKRIFKAIDKKQKVVIYGDYDIDGITASSLLVDFFSWVGLEVSVYIPDRFEEGYGLNADAIETLKKQNVDLVISVDCGVTAVKEANLAKKLKLDLIITDHHEPPKALPTSASAIINPKLRDSKYPFKELAGVGVAFSLVRALIFTKPKLFTKGREKWLLDLVALGTICDVVPLIGENRVLASYGLIVMKKTPRPGLKALADISNTNLSQLQETDLGFRFGPRLNAAGRLEHAKTALNLLLCQDSTQAKVLAEQLNDLNRQRQQQTQEIFDSANKQAKKMASNTILVLSDPGWSSGIIGIVASRIAERWHKPTILLQITDDQAKGSARSYGDFSIIDALKDCEDILDKFGGHAFAAGMSLKTHNIQLLSHRLNNYAIKNINIESLMPRIKIDLAFNELSPDLNHIKSIDNLRPHGNDNPRPLLASKFEMIDKRLIGQDNSHIKFRFRAPNNTILDGIAFSSAHKWLDMNSPNTYEVAYYLQENIWQNVSRVQLEVVDIRVPKE